MLPLDTVWVGPVGPVLEVLTSGPPNPDTVDVEAWAEYARVTPSVRLARWLDQDPERKVTIASGRPEGAWVVSLRDGGTAYGGRRLNRDEALSAALDQAEAATPEEAE